LGEFARVCEGHRGFHGGNYYFVVDGTKLVHISHYSARRESFYGGSCYYVDLLKVRGKLVVEVVSSRGGLFDIVWVYPAEDLALE